MRETGTHAPSAPFWVRPSAGTILQRLRLASGLILFSFALTHFLNHALGNISLAAMQAGQDLRYLVWSSLAGQIVLYGALALHLSLVLAKLAMRRTLRMPPWEAAQILLGLSIPWFLSKHIIATRGAMAAFDTFVDYRHELSILWAGDVFWQSLLLLLVWGHACIGLHFWLRIRPWYPRWSTLLAGVAVAIPLLALTGWIHAARLLDTTNSLKTNFRPGERAQLLIWIDEARTGVIGLLALVAIIHILLRFNEARRSRLRIHYPDGRTVQTRVGPTLLEISRMNRIPLPSVCGGRARCSTCRTMIVKGAESLPPPGPAEREALEKARAGDRVRLACQIRPVSDLRVRPLLRADQGATAIPGEDRYRWGVEQQIVAMFVDLRGFTTVAEKKLPFDTVYILNRYLDGAAAVIRAEGGVIDKVMGDGIMALFGTESGLVEGARQSLRATAGLARALASINGDLASQLERPLRMGIGVHCGSAILGRIGLGHEAAPSGPAGAGLTALGDIVNVASRLESATKDHDAFALISADVYAAAGMAPPVPEKASFETHEAASPADVELRAVAVRGRNEPIEVCIIRSPTVFDDIVDH